MEVCDRASEPVIGTLRTLPGKIHRRTEKILHTVLSLFIFCATLDPICEAHTAEVSNRSAPPSPTPAHALHPCFDTPTPTPSSRGLLSSVAIRQGLYSPFVGDLLLSFKGLSSDFSG